MDVVAVVRVASFNFPAHFDVCLVALGDTLERAQQRGHVGLRVPEEQRVVLGVLNLRHARPHLARAKEEIVGLKDIGALDKHIDPLTIIARDHHPDVSVQVLEKHSTAWKTFATIIL